MGKKKKLKKESANKETTNIFSKFLDDIFDFAIWFLVIMPIFTYAILLLITLVVKKYGLYGLVIASQDGWLGFSGSLLSGTMTLFAVIFTIRYELTRFEKEKSANDEKELFERKMSVMPLIKCELIDQDFKLTSLFDRFHFRLRNISNNHAKNIRLEHCTIKWQKPTKPFSNEFELIESESFQISDESIHHSLLPGKEEYNFSLWLSEPGDIDHYKKVRNSGYRCQVEMIFKSQDILELQTREYIYTLNLSQDLDPLGISSEGHYITVLKFFNETHEY